MSRSKSAASSIVDQLIFVIHLVNVAEFLNATSVPRAATAVTSLVTKM